MGYEFENLQFSYHSRMSSKHDINLAQLVQLYYTEQIQSSQPQRLLTLSYIFTHQQLKSSIKNQSQILKKIFNHSTVKILISYLNQQNKQHAQYLKTIKYDPTGQEVPHCLKMPYMAMELLSCQCHIINDLLFQGEEGNQEPLLPYLLEFLDHTQHYHLASYFSKVINAITKRVCSATHKYNPVLSNYVFGNQNGSISIEKSCLYKAVNHIYSLSMIDCIIRWLSISTKVKIKEEIDGQIFQKVVVDLKRSFKQDFVLFLIDKINKSGFQSQILNNIPSLIEQMLAERDKSNKIASTLMIKAFSNTSSSTQKFTLYDLVIKQEILNAIFGPPEQNRVNLAKLKLIKIFLVRYTNQLALFQKNSQQPIEVQLKLLQMVTFDHLNQLIQWIFTDLKMMLGVDTISNSKESSPHDQQLQNQTSRVRVSSSGKMIILHLLEILKYVHNLTSFRPQLIEYYNENSNCLVRLFKRLMCLENNLIQIETNKLVTIMLRKNMKDKNRPDIPLQFARKLLTIAIIKLIELGVARSHVIQWADKILSIQQQHIFENYQEEFEWDHIREIIEDERKIQVGGYRLVQANLQTFYSDQKAMFAYSDFLNFKAEVVYQDKKQKQKNLEEQTESIQILPVSIPASNQSAQNSKEYEQIARIIEPIIINQNFENKTRQNPALLGLFRSNYLEFDIDDLMKQF